MSFVASTGSSWAGLRSKPTAQYAEVCQGRSKVGRKLGEMPLGARDNMESPRMNWFVVPSLGGLETRFVRATTDPASVEQ